METYLERLLNELLSNNPLVDDLYEDLAENASQPGDLVKVRNGTNNNWNQIRHISLSSIVM